jgi:hypothetical protein
MELKFRLKEIPVGCCPDEESILVEVYLLVIFLATSSPLDFDSLAGDRMKPPVDCFNS